MKHVAKASKAVESKNSNQLPSKATHYQEYEDDMPLTTVEEAANVRYITNPGQVSNGINNWVILLGTSKKPESRMTSFEKIDIIREGISKKDLENLKEKTDLDYNQLSKVLSVARATLINKKGNSKFDSVLSERIVGVADIYSYGYEVFEDEGRFNEWIFRANQSLGGQTPYDLLDNQYGREEVKNLIGRIDYGVYS